MQKFQIFAPIKLNGYHYCQFLNCEYSKFLAPKEIIVEYPQGRLEEIEVISFLFLSSLMTYFTSFVVNIAIDLSQKSLVRIVSIYINFRLFSKQNKAQELFWRENNLEGIIKLHSLAYFLQGPSYEKEQSLILFLIKIK